MDVGILEVLVGGGTTVLSTIGAVWLRQQQAMLDLLKHRNDLEKPSPNGNGINHTKTHMLLDQMRKSIDENRGEFRVGFTELNKQISELNTNLRGRPCIHD